MQVAQLVLLGNCVVASCQAQTGEAVSVFVSRAPSPAASLSADAFVMLAWPHSTQVIEFATKGWYRRRTCLGLHSASNEVSGTDDCQGTKGSGTESLRLSSVTEVQTEPSTEAKV